MRQFLFLILLVSFIDQSKASTYYFSSVSGDDSRTSIEAQDSTTPWKTLNKLNVFWDLNYGDSVLFNRNNTFYGNINVNMYHAGDVNNAIVYGAYGNGANPIITGLSQLSGWTQYTGNIYYVSLDVPALNIVTLDGKMMGMGRYPKTGYLTYTSHSDNNSISGNSVGSLPFDATGAEIVIRKIRQVTDRHIITSASGNTINYLPNGAYGTVYGNNNAYQPNDGNGYFIQSSINALTGTGDWFYDNTNKRLYMYLETDLPTAHTIKASMLDYIVQMDNNNNISFLNLDFEGADIQAVRLNNDNNITFTNCNFYKDYNALSANNGIYNLLIKGGKISEILNDGILVPQMGNNVTIDGVTLNKIGFIAGAGGSGDGQQVGAWMNADNSTVRNCTLTNMGFHGIVLYGNNTLVEKNYVDTFANIKDDAGGIYLFGMGRTNQIIRNNTVLNAIGAMEGAPPYQQVSQAAGIYIDNADNVQVLNNVVAHGTWAGIWLVDVGTGVQIKKNIVYDHQDQLQIFNTKQMTGLSAVGNEFIAKTPLQNTLYIHTYANVDPSLYGTLDSNIYARPIEDNMTISIFREYSGGGESNMSLATWKTTYNQDKNSLISSKPIDNIEKLRLEYNYSNSSKTFDLTDSYTNINTLTYSNTVTILPYSAAVLVQGTTNTNSILPLQFLNFAGKWMTGDKNVNLEWTTSNEINNMAFFNIEKSSDAVNFKLLDTVTFNRLSTYKLTDYNPFKEKNYYRIKKIDSDGKALYSSIILLNNKATDKTISFWPNPAKDFITISLPIDLLSTKPLSVRVISASGAVAMMKIVQPQEPLLLLDISKLPTGTYFLELANDLKLYSSALLKQ